MAKSHTQLRRRAVRSKSDGVGYLSAMLNALSAPLQLRGVLEDYAAKAERAMTAHPIPAIVGAAALGYLVARLSW